jgi:hypothetical protein
VREFSKNRSANSLKRYGQGRQFAGAAEAAKAMKLAEIEGFDGQRTGKISTSVEGRQRGCRKLSQAIAAAMESVLQQRRYHTLFLLKIIFCVPPAVCALRPLPTKATSQQGGRR